MMKKKTIDGQVEPVVMCWLVRNGKPVGFELEEQRRNEWRKLRGMEKCVRQGEIFPSERAAWESIIRDLRRTISWATGRIDKIEGIIRDLGT
jgi:hypothetical protein